jgi:hypothetical protein
MWCWAFSFILKGHHLEFFVLMPLEPNLLVMCERIGEALEIVYDVVFTY